MSPLDRTDGGNKSQTRRSTKDGERGRPYSRRRDCRTSIISRFSEKTPFLSVISGRSLAAVYNVNERSLHVGPPLLERIRETSISLRWNARKEREGKGEIIEVPHPSRSPISPLRLKAITILATSSEEFLPLSVYIEFLPLSVCSDNTAARALAFR